MSLISFSMLIGLFGALIGSFINMAAYRIPKQLYFSWFLECYDFLELKPKFTKVPSLELNIFYPRSHCPNCKKKIYFFDNIPILSYFLLRSKCRNCQQKISWSYPLVELITLICSVVVAFKFGLDPKVAFALVFTWVLILQSLIDLKEYIIPDELTLPMLWLGLIINNFKVFVDLPAALFGAIGGYVIFWLIYWLFKLITGKEGLGYGDFKLLAMLGAWCGYQQLLLIILIASALGSIVGIMIIFYWKQDKNKPLPFGPYLGIAGWIALLWGSNLKIWYLQYL